ncbi:putative uroporphyrinogen decarboxylase [Leptospira inadai serovar Lyme str. 10]|uniref:Uroporphyrinogen decarboxylase n=2 Tax=Leptospira inadai serovar Lyme TaxID=293084 RepID=A0ABX4YNZ5_9LEPT|nr:uroporphyrinogen decarboxylase family protein [Leptospira inadai]EQA35727.1 putative uroporphyrinogen decarboxylase [Leptospira inadai serovar Lyme str. 10]PNV77001.1 uroporphyrinogen decarboxylase [Leptospira inadai serovar Lyme]
MPNQKFTNALQCKAQSIPPIWMMRQAGRYHSHYQNLRKKHTFEELCKIPELAAEVAFGPVDDFGFDTAILFSDILFPLEALGMGLKFGDDGPKLGWQLAQSSDLGRMHSLEQAVDFMGFQKKAVALTRKRIPEDRSLIGFIGGPWTLFCYATLGKHDGNLILPKVSPLLREGFYKKLLPLLRENIRLQLEGGAEIVMIFDTAGGDASPGFFNEAVFPPLRELAESFPGKIGYYAKGISSQSLGSIRSLAGLAGFGVDHRIELTELFGKRKQFIQGNFDQAMLFLDPGEFRSYLMKWLEPFLRLTPDQRSGWICGLGHGVLPKTPEANVRNFVKTVREVFA